MARPTDCNQKTVSDAEEAAARGLKRDLIGPYIGVSRRSFYEWMARGRSEPESIYGAFLHAVERGECKGAAMLLDKVVVAADEDWRAAQFLLKTRHGYSEKTEQEVTIKGGEDIGRNASPAERARDAARKLRGS